MPARNAFHFSLLMVCWSIVFQKFFLETPPYWHFLRVCVPPVQGRVFKQDYHWSYWSLPLVISSILLINSTGSLVAPYSSLQLRMTSILVNLSIVFLAGVGNSFLLLPALCRSPPYLGPGSRVYFSLLVLATYFCFLILCSFSRQPTPQVLQKLILLGWSKFSLFADRWPIGQVAVSANRKKNTS